MHETEEFRVVTFVANYEARIERMTVRRYCVCVSPCARVGLGENDVAVRVETMRGGEPGDAGADDGNPHLRRNPPRRPQLLSTE
jgi:hypothetical protein